MPLWAINQRSTAKSVLALHFSTVTLQICEAFGTNKIKHQWSVIVEKWSANSNSPHIFCISRIAQELSNNIPPIVTVFPNTIYSKIKKIKRYKDFWEVDRF